jgi:hypothetical protein
MESLGEASPGMLKGPLASRLGAFFRGGKPELVFKGENVPPDQKMCHVAHVFASARAIKNSPGIFNRKLCGKISRGELIIMPNCG